MTFVSLAINYKLRPKYRKFGTSVGEFLADVVDAKGEKRQKIIDRSAKAVTVGLSLGCAVLTADAVGAIHAVAAGSAMEVAHATAVHGAVVSPGHGAVTGPVPAAPAFPPVAATHGVPSGYGGGGNLGGWLAGSNVHDQIMNSVGQDQDVSNALIGTDAAMDSGADLTV